jgi:integration host factor subunit beta
MGESMNRSDLIAYLTRTQALPDSTARDIVHAIFDIMSKRLADGGRVELRGFGTFTTRSRKARDGRNPKSGEVVAVNAKRVPYFKPSRALQIGVDVYRTPHDSHR